jgi:uncharacterized membrane protein YdbT with pleckstrin-like domain
MRSHAGATSRRIVNNGPAESFDIARAGIPDRARARAFLTLSAAVSLRAILKMTRLPPPGQ